MSTPGDLVAERYRLVRQLGDGGLGVVWEALDELLGRTVAVRELQSQRSLNPTEAELAMREARMTARLEHPYAVPVFDVVDHQGQIWLIMQFVPSQPLSTLLRGLAVLSPGETARIGFQVASALAAAHELGIVHGDVRPGNVLIADDGTALISGFGISRALGYDADVYGLGATLFAAAEGAPPSATDQDPLDMQTVATSHVGPPTPTVGLTPLLLRMLADDPGARPSMAEVAALLGKLGDYDATSESSAAPAGLPSAGPSPQPAPGRGRRAGRTLTAAGLLSALVAVGILLATVLPDLGRGLDRAAGVPDADPSAGLYVSANFAVPFQLAAPTWVAPEPQVDKRELVTWQTADVSIRFLVPLEVYPPGKKGPTPPPEDYLSYLLGLSGEGARFTDRSLTTVDGRPATLVTATASRRLAGAIGCPEVGMAQQRCYGLHPERRLRIAVVELGGRTLLIWLRSDRRSSFEEERQRFEWTLGTVRFR